MAMLTAMELSFGANVTFDVCNTADTSMGNFFSIKSQMIRLTDADTVLDARNNLISVPVFSMQSII